MFVFDIERMDEVKKFMFLYKFLNVFGYRKVCVDCIVLRNVNYVENIKMSIYIVLFLCFCRCFYVFFKILCKIM